MDLGIAGRWAVIGAASRGLGKGCASALAKEGVNLVLNARGVEALEATRKWLGPAFRARNRCRRPKSPNGPFQAREEIVSQCRFATRG